MNISMLTNLLEYHEKVLIPMADPRTREWPLINGSPKAVWAMSICYLSFVFFGPRFMKDRKPRQLQGFMIVYNFALVALSLYMFIELLLSSYYAGYGLICNPYNEETIRDPRSLRVASVLWVYYYSKAVEFIDTVLMVLRKKFDQVTFLHVYHHVSMLNIWFYVMLFCPGGCAVFSSTANSFVHVIMYAYYGLAAIPSMRPYLWWKKYLTNLQLSQFLLVLIHTLYVSFTDCDFPVWGEVLLTGYMLSMLILFGNFYRQAYIKGRRLNESKKKQIQLQTLASETLGSIDTPLKEQKIE